MANVFPLELSEKGRAKNDGFIVLSRPRALLLAVCVIFCIIIVGVVAGVVSSNDARSSAEQEYQEKLDRQTADKEGKSTEPPDTVATDTVTQPSPTTTAPSCKEGPWCNVRLPRNVIPYHYDLDLKADVEKLVFNGTIRMYIKVVSDTDTVLVHIKGGMTISAARMYQMSDKWGERNGGIDISKSFEYPKNEYYVVQTLTKLSSNVGFYIYELEFSSNVSTALTGFYNSSYNEKQNVLLTTKFQPTDSRKAFPNFDEPDMKTTFNISVEHPENYHARSNMPAMDSVKSSLGFNKTSFGRTVRMSSYLVCFIVSQFESSFSGAAGLYNNFTLSIWSRPEYTNKTEYAYNTGRTMMKFLEGLTAVPYVMPKLDMFAIPDYGSGATEHWGIVTYREARLLHTPGLSSASEKQNTASIIAHECAHLWFGNLVTCEWWNDLWVQEGMASYLEYLAIDAAQPDWNMMDYFVTGDWKTGMSLDALASSHPISQEVHHPKQIKEIFDSITYNKGSSLFLMLHDYLGNERFRAGITNYLTDKQFAGATATDLWNGFSKASGEDIRSMMETWTQQMGHPVITIGRIENNINNTRFTLTQKHFLLDPTAVVTQKSKFNYIWKIPFTYYASSNEKKPMKLLLNKSEEIVDLGVGGQAIIGNVGHKGFYRVNYDNYTWQYIVSRIQNDHQDVPVSDRAGIIDDGFNLARAGLLNYETALSLTEYLGKEDSYFPWKMALNNLAYFDKVLKDQKGYGLFRIYMQKLISPMIKKIGFNTSAVTGHMESFLQTKLINNACSYGNTDALNYISGMFKSWMENGTSIPADLKSIVLWYGVALGGDEEWDFVFKKFSSNITSPSDRSKLQVALSATEKPWILRKWLSYSIDSTKVRTQDMVYVIGKVASSNTLGRYMAWDFARENWIKIMKIASANNFHETVITQRITSQFTTEYDLQQVEAFWAQHPDAGAGARAREQGIEKIRASIGWVETHYRGIEAWLQAKMTSPSGSGLEFSISSQWDSAAISHTPVQVALTSTDPRFLDFSVTAAPFFNDPSAPNGPAGKPFPKLWDYEVVEIFLLGDADKYLEVEVSPHGQHLVLMLDGVRKMVRDQLEMQFEACIDQSARTWSGTARIPVSYLPSGVNKLNAYAIHGSADARVYEALYPAPQDAHAQPDFHRLQYFKELDLSPLSLNTTEIGQFWLSIAIS